MSHCSLKLGAFALGALATSWALAQQPAEVVVYGPAPKPVPVPGAKPIAMPSFDALKGDGVYYFQGAKVSNLRLAGAAAEANRYPLAESSTDANETTLNGHIDVAHAVLNGERRALGRPNFAIPANDGSFYIVYAGQATLRMAVSMQAFDVSELPISQFLRTTDNYPRQEATKAGSARFPRGSVAYLATARFLDDVLMLPKRESFTGATNTTQFVGNFSKQIPYCLAYEDRQGAKPYAMFFKQTGAAKKGEVVLYPAKTGTLFCDKAAEQVLAQGEWEEKTVSGTKAVVLSFPAQVDPLDTGVTNVERESARIAFVEPTKGLPGVRPGKLYQAGASVYDYQYRFNKTAADAVRAAIGAAQ
ncbi:MAG TPA: hypothetical protein PLE54_14165 [Burkholderiaceae bacterium]|nr:hypothetical protein [Burkholderiaceae bacterium]HQR71750.1 hypothetical protein [Burkholderiaceae bacterium]